MEHAILKTLAYADIFDYPLSADEIHHYLTERSASLAEVQAALAAMKAAGRLERRGGYYMLCGREGIAEVRRRRSTVARQMWPRALHYGALMGSLPYVRMVAVTGALSVDNVEGDDDIDYMIVTQPDRLWLCRSLIILMVRWARRRGDFICPNYLVSESALVFSDRSLYTAHEVVQMVPVAGLEVYTRLRQVNNWVQSYLPNARSMCWQRLPPAEMTAGRVWRGAARAMEFTLSSPLGTALEHWESTRKIRRMRRNMNGGSEADFSPECCKGHFDSHGNQTLAAYSSRLRAVEPGE